MLCLSGFELYSRWVPLCIEYFNFSLNKSQFCLSKLRGHEAFSNCFVVSGVVYSGLTAQMHKALIFFYLFKILSFFLQLYVNNSLVVILVSLVSPKWFPYGCSVLNLTYVLPPT